MDTTDTVWTMDTSPVSLKGNGDGMDTSPFQRRMVMGWPPLHSIYRG